MRVDLGGGDTGDGRRRRRRRRRLPPGFDLEFPFKNNTLKKVKNLKNRFH